MKNPIRNLKGLAVFSGLAVNTLVCVIPLFLFAIVKLLIPLQRFRVAMTRWIMAIGELWVDINAMILSTVNNTQWEVYGAEKLSRDKWYLVIANHQTWVDIIALQTQFNRRVPFLKFFIKQELVWFPFLGLAWWAMDMPFMKRYSKSYLAKHPEKKGRDLQATREACRKFRKTPTSLINFIEGTRFSAEKKVKRSSQFEHLLPPRAGGMALALSSMGEMFDAILDITLVYPDGPPPRFWGMTCGEFSRVVIEITPLPVEEWMIRGDYSNDREYRKRFHQWLTDLWQSKDERIGEFKLQQMAQVQESA